jgi:predicted carbohydrate-binding protein with CBM5 and CBM33 domain
MNRKLMILAVMLLTMAVLSMPSSVCAFGYCENCVEQCYNEAMGPVYSQCRDNGGSVAECDAQAAQYDRNCVAVICNGAGCNSVPKSGPIN